MAELYLHAARQEATSRLDAILSELGDAQKIVAGKACVYVTGSFGRLEAGPNSDLDLFIVVETSPKEDGALKRDLNRVDEIKVQSDLIRAAENNDVAKFDRGGEFLSSHEIQTYIEWLGTNEDDYRNTLTGRMLMLLESRVMAGEDTYKKVIRLVLERYFRDFEGHEENFIPAFLFNDILRMWRTFCVNYESRRGGDSRDKIKNLKLKFSRMLTCYSGIVYLQAVFARNHTVRAEDVEGMIALSPTERLETIATVAFWNRDEVDKGIISAVNEAIQLYSEFLELAHKDIKKAVKEHGSEEDAWRERSSAFGQSLANLIDVLGGMSEEAARLRRLILI